MAIDRKTNTTLWRDAIAKEMRNVMTAFEFCDDDVVSPGYTEIKFHLVLDVKMHLPRKVRFVASGHMTPPPPKDRTYSSVVTHESVCIALTLAALNDLDVLTCDIQNAYLNAPTKEKVWCRAGDEGANTERPVLIARALYGLKSSGASLKGVYKLKDGSVGQPTTYRGADIKEWSLPSFDDPGKKYWAMSSECYVKRVIKEVEAKLDLMGRKLATKVTTPLAPGYCPELDQTKELIGDDIQYYQGLVGILRWVCELGRIDILIPLSLMSRYLVSPRDGRLEQMFHIFAYLSKRYSRSTLVFDDSPPEPIFTGSDFNANADWSA